MIVILKRQQGRIMVKRARGITVDHRISVTSKPSSVWYNPSLKALGAIHGIATVILQFAIIDAECWIMTSAYTSERIKYQPDMLPISKLRLELGLISARQRITNWKRKPERKNIYDQLQNIIESLP